MTDATKITTPFGLLDKEAQDALRKWPHGYECYSVGGWRELETPSFLPYHVYRARPAPITQPSIDWSHVVSHVNWLARDEDGEGWLFEFKPSIRKGEWRDSGECIPADFFASYAPGTCDWRDSLIRRPGHEGV